MKFNKLSLKLGSAIVLEGLSKVVLFFVTILLAKTLSITDFGRWNLWIVTIGYLQILIEFGTPMKGVRTVAEGVDDEGLRHFQSLRLIGFLASVVLLTVLYLLFGYGDIEVLALLLWCFFFLFNADWFLRGKSLIQFVGRAYFLSNLILLATVIYLYFSGQVNSDKALLLVLGARVLVTVCIVLSVNWKSISSFGYHFRTGLGSIAKSPYLRPCLYLVAGAFFARIYYNSSVFVVEYFEGEEQLGYYSAGALFYAIFIAGRAVVIGASYPILCSFEDRTKLNAIIRKASLAIGGLFIPVMIFALLRPELLLSVITDAKYVTDEVIDVFMVFQFTCLVLSFGIFTVTRLHLYSLEAKFFRITVIIGIVGLTVNLILIPVIGILGGAIATLIAETGTIVLSKLTTRNRG